MVFVARLYLQNMCVLCFTLMVCKSDVRYINWTLATERGQSHKERDYSHPAYNEVAVSPCDLTEDSCDIHCCSDQDCSLEQKSGFNCFGGLQDGQKTQSLTEENCLCHLSENACSEWLHLFCYVITNTPYVGQYFVTQKKVDTLAAFSDSLVNKKDYFNFQMRTVFDLSESDVFAYYKHGSLIMMNSDDVVGNRPKHLEMPANIFYPNGGVCIDPSPVRFLVNREARCVRAISRERCERPMHSPLSAQSYIIADSVINVSHTSRYLHVAMDSLGHKTVHTELKFLCFSNGSNYVSFSHNVFRSNVSNMIFKPQVPEDGLSLPECSSSIEDILMTSYDKKEEICRNVFISVFYDFVWSGTDIVNLTATYVLADVPVTPRAFITLKSNISGGVTTNDFIMPRHEAMHRMELYLSQYFVAKFRHYKSVKALDVNISAEEDTATYPEHPGYEVGHPVVALNKNDTSFTWEEVLLEVWGKHAECGETKPLEFGYDVITSCRLEMGIEDFEDCDSMRNRVLRLQESLISGDFVSQGGAIRKTGINVTASEPVVPILRLPLINGSAHEGDMMARMCPEMPSTLAVDIMYTALPEPSPEGRRFHRIVGVRIGFQAVHWALDSSSDRQKFTLTSMVTFVPVPFVDEKPKSRFWMLMTSPDESETAWLNLFQIVDEFSTGDEMVEMSACGIVLAALSLSLCILLRSDM
ncbi:tectonic-2-like isoform X2 [Cryptotermes secundus]|uniref:tectonic-2-like isoform X2 n=1 Tax=Cryptotermes secundus TaxID=105785 RepID=UPI001454D8FA|nr:tectonic-2-like isoform X2 [Cryptotermes secundus]